MRVIVADKSWWPKWDEFVKANSSDFGLLQSLVWGDFQASLDRKVFRLAAVEGEEILAAAQIVKMPLRFGRSYFYAPRGPVLFRGGKEFKISDLKFLDQSEKFSLLFDEIKKLAQKEKVIFFRFEPTDQENNKTKNRENTCLASTSDSESRREKTIKQKNKFRFVGQVQPKETLILDLVKSEEDLLKQMKPKTRYNIKVAEKHHINVDEGADYFDDFWRLTKMTAERQEIKPHSEFYYRQITRILGDSGVLKLMVAKDDDRVIAANLGIFFGSWGVYLHGASDYDYRDKMAPFLLQWSMIKHAKKNGCLFYDFWGVDEKKWPGVTRFKTGFAPAVLPVEYVGAWDEVYAGFWYNLYRLIKVLIK